MRISTTINLLKSFEKCPKCGRTMTMDGLKVDENKFELKCECGWRMEGKEY